NTVIIMTSNVGASSITEPRRLGFTDEQNAADADKDKMRSTVMDALKATFRPEFLNRLDEIIIFNKLTDVDIEKITSIMLGEVQKRINGLGIGIEFSEDVVKTLAKEGFDPVYGARPLRRAIVRRVEDTFSEEMIAGNVREGDKVRAVMKDGAIAYEKE
ncbi:MAG: ATP-dependent Clp protease ATP-binding subunit, partial [Clostridia bacterium]|nr:ATP-dependent Clp protease ATP-binding subunit [Clostridia bacterium]